MSTLKPMMKVSLSFKAGIDPEKLDIPLDQPDFEFVFGIGSGGLTPFEYELADLAAGDEINFRLNRAERQRFFEHLWPPVLGLFLDRSELFFNARINSINPADSREVVKAMAEMTAQGESGCGCGCGGSCGS